MQKEPKRQGHVYSSKLQELGENDSLTIKQIWKFPVPTAHEVKLLFDYYPDYTQEKVVLGMIAIEIMRPCEVPEAEWPDFVLNEDQTEITWLYHDVFKARNTRNKQGGENKNIKETKKPMWSKWLSEQIIRYGHITPAYACNRVFSFRKSDSIRHFFVLLHKEIKKGELSPEYHCFLDRNGVVVKGQDKTQYRINPYALRRFGMTFHYWVTFKQDVIALAKMTGHARPDTLLQYYIMPKEAIGLTQRMIDDNITIDEFIHLHGKKQMRLLDFMPENILKMLPVGQTTLRDF